MTPLRDQDTEPATDRHRLPDLDLTCQHPHHPEDGACHATGVRDGIRYSCFWWPQ